MKTKNRGIVRRGLATAILAALVTSGSAAASEWRQVEDPAEAGWSIEVLEAARETAVSAGSDAVMVVEDGVVVAAWGTVDRPSPIYSMRKGLYNALLGTLVEEGSIRLDATLAELGIEEIDSLTEAERSATVADLLASQSGVYHESAYEPASMKRGRPERGSHPPGTYWFYNNWDFNLVAHLIERASGRKLGELFAERLAGPLGMEDFTSDDVFRFLEPSRSRFPAVVFWMSARDLARVGQLYLQEGEWEGRALLSRSWIEESWKPRWRFAEDSPFGGGNGFGYLWWIYPSRSDAETPSGRRDIYLTRGSDGQVVAVLPALDLVFVHQNDGDEADFADAFRILDQILAAREAEPGPGVAARTVPLAPGLLGKASPPRERRSAVPWSPDDRDRLVGEYLLSPRVSFVVHELGDRLFALPEGAPLAEVELFRDRAGTIFSPAVEVSLTPIEGESGAIVALEGTMEGRPVRLEKRGSEEESEGEE